MKSKLLYIHIPKTAGLYLGEYINENLPYRRFLSNKVNESSVWTDYTLEELKGFLHEEPAFLQTHTLSYGWHELAYIIPPTPQEQIVDTIRRFKKHGWFTFAFVRHPGDILCSFYHYVYDFHERKMPHVVSAHAPVIDRSLDTFVAEHCIKPLLPSYWRELDHVAEANDVNFAAFFKRYLDHDFEPRRSPSHASGSRRYQGHCKVGDISEYTQRLVEESLNTQIYREITASQDQTALFVCQ